MATFSAYLMWLLSTQLKELCPYCLASASLSFSMAALTWSKRIVPEPTKAAVRLMHFNSPSHIPTTNQSTPQQVYKGGSILVTGLFSVGAYIYASARTLVLTGGIAGGGEAGILKAPPPITTHSDERSVRLAGELQVR